MGYKFKAVSGFTWRQLFYIITNLVAVAKMIILARILVPYDFGLFSITAIALGLSEAFTQTGINLTILQSKHKTEYFIDTAWIIAITRGVIIGLIMVGLAFLLPSFYQEPLLKPLILIAGLVPLIKGFINPVVVSLQKELHFFKNTVYSLSRIIIEAIVAVLLAFYLQNAFAFVWALVIGAGFEVVISFCLFKTRPKLKFSKKVALLIFQNAKGLTPMAALNYIHENVDNLIIGKTLGASKLGVYQNAYALSHKANYQLAQAANHGLLPIFAKIQTDQARLRRAFLKALVLTSLIMVAVSSLLFVWPDLVVNLVLGNKWRSATPIIPILTLAGLLQGLAMLFYSLFLARARFKLINLHLGLTVILLIIFTWWGSLKLGLVGASWGIALSRVISLPILIYGAYQELKINSAQAAS